MLFLKDILLLNLQQFILLTFPQVKARFGNLQGRNKFLLFIFARIKLILLEGRQLSIGLRFKEEQEKKENKTLNH